MFAVVHARAGRVRLKIPGLIDNDQLVRDLQYQLVVRREIISASASAITGNLLVHCNPSLSLDVIDEIINDAYLAATHIKPPSNVWWQRSVADTLVLHSVSTNGLSRGDADERLDRYGKNVHRLPAQYSDWRLLARQFNSLPVMLLCASAAMSVVTGGLFDAALVAGVVVANAGIGFFSERSAERIIDSLINNDHLKTTVRRDGRFLEISAENIVPGDLLQMTAGDLVVADVRIMESDGLTIDESSLTGESLPINKTSGLLDDPRLPLADRCNMAFCGTTVTAGRGIGIVIATGFSTELGRITLAVAGTERQPTPMQEQINHLGRQLTTASIVSGAAVFGFGYLRGIPMLELIRGSIALAVAAIPEGLPMVATFIQATGLQAARQRHVLIRSLNAVETVGSVNVVCFDKTGTLTCNQMRVTTIVLDQQTITLDESSVINRPQYQPLIELMQVAVLCNESAIEDHGINGSSTEAALLHMAMQAGIDIAALRDVNPLIHMERRSETQRYMKTTHVLNDDTHFIAIKGNPQDVLALCAEYHGDSGVARLTEGKLAEIGAANDAMADDGLRVLGFAFARQSEGEPIKPVWLGMVGMADPPRPHMAALIEHFHDAGIRTVMITGDQARTAKSVAEQVALAPEIRLHDASRDTPDDLAEIDVFARVTPLQKLHVVRRLRQAGNVVAMIGDGTNDGPALRAADIGVTFGRDGTDAARTIADVVLGRDDLMTMIVAVEQGRTISENVRKAIHFLLGTNSSEVMLTVLATALGAGQPLNTSQLLYINIVTDVAIAYALGHEPAESDVMERPPRSRSQPIIDRDDYRRLLGKGTLLTGSAFAAHLYGMARHGGGGGGIGMLTLLTAQLLDGFSSRSRSIAAWDLPSNTMLNRTVFGLLALQSVICALPVTRGLLGIAPLSLVDLAVIGGGATLPFLLSETITKQSPAGMSFHDATHVH